MTYDDLVTQIALATGLHSDVVKKVLYYFPEVLQGLSVDESVRTPLGVFRMTKRDARPIKLPNGTSHAVVQEKVVVRLKSGAQMEKKGI